MIMCLAIYKRHLRNRIPKKQKQNDLIEIGSIRRNLK